MLTGGIRIYLSREKGRPVIIPEKDIGVSGDKK